MNDKTLKNKVQTSLGQSLTSIYISLIMFGLPLVVTRGYNNITETKSAFFIILTILFLIVIFIWQGLELIKKKNSIKFECSVLDLSTIVFAMAIFVSSVLSVYQDNVWFGQNSRFQGAIVVFLYVLLYFVISRNYPNRQTFLNYSIIAFSLVCIFGVLNCFGIDLFGFHSNIPDDFKKIFISTIGNINFYSAYCCLLLPLLICGYCLTKTNLSKTIYAISLVIGSFGLMVTGSESFVVGFAVAIIIMSFFMLKNKEILKKYFLSLILILVSALVYRVIYAFADVKFVEISLFLSFVTHPVMLLLLLAICFCCYYSINKNERAVNVIKKVYVIAVITLIVGIIVCFVISNTIGFSPLDKYFKITFYWGTYRGGIWAQCIELIKDFSIKEKFFGIGPESLRYIFNSSAIFANETIDQAHNEYLNYLLTTGLFGLSSYLFMIFSVCVVVLKMLKNNTLAIGVFSSLVAYWIQGLFNLTQPFTTPIMYVYIAIIGGLVYSNGNRHKKCFNIKKYKREM